MSPLREGSFHTAEGWGVWVLAFLNRDRGWSRMSTIRRGAAALYREDLSRRGINFPPSWPSKDWLRGFLQRNLQERKVVCKLGNHLAPYFLGGEGFRARFWYPTRIPPQPQEESLREVAEGFNHRVDHVWFQGFGPLPDPWSLRRILPRLPGSDLEEPVDPVEFPESDIFRRFFSPSQGKMGGFEGREETSRGQNRPWGGPSSCCTG